MYFQSRVQMMRVCEAKKTARGYLESLLSFAKLTGVHSKPAPSFSAAGLCSGTQPTLFVSTVSELWFEKTYKITGFIGTVLSPGLALVARRDGFRHLVAHLSEGHIARVTACVSSVFLCSILPPGERRNQTKTLFYFFRRTSKT